MLRRSNHAPGADHRAPAAAWSAQGLERVVAVGALRGDSVIEFPADSPHSPEITKLVEDIARDTLVIGMSTMKIFYYVNDEMEITETDPYLPRETERLFTDWFEDYYEGHRSLWDESHIVVYSDEIAGLDQVRYHVVLGPDLPVYALCVNRKTGEAQWYRQETTTANTLAAKKK